MPQQKHNTEQLTAYREAAVELREFSLGLKQQIDTAGETGQLQDAQALFVELQARTEELTKLRESLGPTGIFLARYNVVVHNEHTVSFVLPRGVSRLEMLEEAQWLVTERDLIWPNQLTKWRQDPKFNRAAERSERICICGHVKGSTEKGRREQEVLVGKENIPSLEDLAVAFAAHWIATGEPLFGWYKKLKWSYLVRAVDGVLYFSSSGLCVSAMSDGGSSSTNVVVAARSSPKASTFAATQLTADKSAGVLTKAGKSA